MKRILFLTYRLPNSLLKDGYSIRALGLAEILNKKYRIDLASLYQNEKDLENKEGIQKIFNNIFLFQKNVFSEFSGAIKGIFTSSPIQEEIYFSPKMERWIIENYRNYNLIFCETLRTVKYVKNLKIKKVVDLIESLSLKYIRANQFVNPFWKLIYQIEIPRIKKREKEILKDFDRAFISSPFDKEYLEQQATGNKQLTTYNSKLVVIPNGVKEEVLTTYNLQLTTYKEENWISFFGKMDYQPNEDAVCWFSREVFPRLKNKIPDLKFYIVGTNPTKKIKKLKKNKNIKITDYLKNPYEILRKSKLIVVPLRFGAGIQNKVLESMALGKPVVTSPIGAQGIPEAKSGEHFEVIKEDRPEIWVEKIVTLILNSKKRNDVGKKAKKIIEENYRWEKIGDKLLEVINELTN